MELILNECLIRSQMNIGWLPEEETTSRARVVYWQAFDKKKIMVIEMLLAQVSATLFSEFVTMRSNAMIGLRLDKDT